MADERKYDEDEVRAIIDHALNAQEPRAGATHEDLLAIGEGVGLSREALESAATAVREQRVSSAARSRVLARRRRGLLVHALCYLFLNACFFAVNSLTTPGQWWVLFPVFFWGLALVLHAAFALSSRVSPARLARERRGLEKARPASTDALPPTLAPNPRARVAATPGAAPTAEPADSLEEDWQAPSPRTTRQP